MELVKILSASLLGTTFMTVFSHFLGKISGHRFNEARLFNQFLKRSAHFPNDMGRNDYRGWVAHYIIGLLFAVPLYLLYHHTTIALHFPIWFFLGIVLGCLGSAGWYLMYSLHSSLLNLPSKGFLCNCSSPMWYLRSSYWGRSRSFLFKRNPILPEGRPFIGCCSIFRNRPGSRQRIFPK